jgi:nucleosome binding factor SPN SPT16 subunit
MNILVRPSANRKDQPWEVCLDQQAVRFRSELEARSFVATLEARLKAPHQLPELVQRAAS